ncbi:cadmium resistance transporter [Corynebacterium aquatimens]|uniref:Cadmium resistance protein CadD (Predicted permease) n=1 Tax=Corynebacterium aquatimens TaxID=1190508 RepID=A0A931DWH1_9CORY|nr:cadmium resistance transporter [Corynebacterium aquatimens]MBG6122799.1 cadmium resistance protein CadD (predicted permease) [Corynebacterium aquatimens]WJY66866.1 Cadmium resistance transporter [Corynebacterium aquatimens]
MLIDDSPLLPSIAAAVGLFIATNIDDIIILSLFFARGRGRTGAIRTIAAGQYIGFIGILILSVATAIGSAAVLPPWAIPLFGLVPLGIGLWEAWEAWESGDRGEDSSDTGSDSDESGQLRNKTLNIATVAGVTFANGGDNIGVYVPVFVQVPPTTVAVYCIVFLILIAPLVWAAHYITSREPIAELLERFETILFPAMMILLGIAILAGGYL